MFHHKQALIGLRRHPLPGSIARNGCCTSGYEHLNQPDDGDFLLTIQHQRAVEVSGGRQIGCETESIDAVARQHLRLRHDDSWMKKGKDESVVLGCLARRNVGGTPTIMDWDHVPVSFPTSLLAPLPAPFADLRKSVSVYLDAYVVMWIRGKAPVSKATPSQGYNPRAFPSF